MKRVDTYIEKQKAILPSPLLENRIWLGIEKLQQQEKDSFEFSSAWSKALVAACVVVGLVTGVFLGSLYQGPELSKKQALLVNDTYIENFSYYAEHKDE